MTSTQNTQNTQSTESTQHTQNTGGSQHTQRAESTQSAQSTQSTETAESTTALLVIDVQESFRQRDSWQAASDPEVAVQVARLVEFAREQGHLVVWVLHSEPGGGTVFDPALGHVRLIEGLVAADCEPVLTKTSHNAFTTTNLQQLLTARGIRSLITCGIRVEQCVETTTRLASDLGFDVTFVVDASATEPIPHPDAPAGRPIGEVLGDPRTLMPAEVIERTRYALAGRFATVTTLKELTGS